MGKDQSASITRRELSAPNQRIPIFILSERRVPYPALPSTQRCVPNQLNTNTMKTSITRIVPAVTNEGLSIEIPRSAWNDIEEVARQEFGVDLAVMYQPTGGIYDGGRSVPFEHYLLATRLDLNVADAFIARMDPLINDVVERHTPLAVLA